MFTSQKLMGAGGVLEVSELYSEHLFGISTASTTQTQAGVPLGDAHADRRIIAIYVSDLSNSGWTGKTATIAGVSMTKHADLDQYRLVQKHLLGREYL